MADEKEIPVSPFFYAVRCMAVALRFLTVLPLPVPRWEEGKYFKNAPYFFSLAGCVIGLIGFLVCWLLGAFLPVPVVAIVLTIFLSAISGFLHLDGLADTADGFLSARPADTCLEIMRDSRIGVMGTAAVCAVFLSKAAALATMDVQTMAHAVVLMPVAGRTSIVLSMALLPYARKEGGLGDLFYTKKTWRAALLSILIFLAVGYAAGTENLWLASLILIFVVVVFSRICRKRINGATGDTLGAVCELSETSLAIALSVTI